MLDRTATEPSKRVLALANGSRVSASMEMSAPKNQGHVRAWESLDVSTEVEVAMLNLPPPQLSRMRKDIPDDGRTVGASNSLVPPGPALCFPTGASSPTKPSSCPREMPPLRYCRQSS